MGSLIDGPNCPGMLGFTAMDEGPVVLEEEILWRVTAVVMVGPVVPTATVCIPAPVYGRRVCHAFRRCGTY